MKTKEQILEPYLWEDNEGGENVCSLDALTAMDEYTKSFFDWIFPNSTKTFEYMLQQYEEVCKQ